MERATKIKQWLILLLAVLCVAEDGVIYTMAQKQKETPPAARAHYAGYAENFDVEICNYRDYEEYLNMLEKEWDTAISHADAAETAYPVCIVGELRLGSLYNFPQEVQEILRDEARAQEAVGVSFRAADGTELSCTVKTWDNADSCRLPLDCISAATDAAPEACVVTIGGYVYEIPLGAA